MHTFVLVDDDVFDDLATRSPSTAGSGSAPPGTAPSALARLRRRAPRHRGGGAPLAWCAATAGGRLLTSGADKQLKAWTLPDLVLEASFAANGAFGSADGVGGEGALSAADGRVAVGDGSGRLYALELVGV